jgi:hypothetical protein
LIKRFIDKDAKFRFIFKDDPIPHDAIASTLPKAQTKPVEGKLTIYDALIQRYQIQDAATLIVGKVIHDFETNAEEDTNKVKFKETLGLCHMLKGLKKVSKTDNEIIEKALIVLDAFHASLLDVHEQ